MDSSNGAATTTHGLIYFIYLITSLMNFKTSLFNKSFLLFRTECVTFDNIFSIIIVTPNHFVIRLNVSEWLVAGYDCDIPDFINIGPPNLRNCSYMQPAF
jgi:hypothetical protein